MVCTGALFLKRSDDVEAENETPASRTPPPVGGGGGRGGGGVFLLRPVLARHGGGGFLPLQTLTVECFLSFSELAVRPRQNLQSRDLRDHVTTTTSVHKWNM